MVSCIMIVYQYNVQNNQYHPHNTLTGVPTLCSNITMFPSQLNVIRPLPSTADNNWLIPGADAAHTHILSNHHCNCNIMIIACGGKILLGSIIAILGDQVLAIKTVLVLVFSVKPLARETTSSKITVMIKLRRNTCSWLPPTQSWEEMCPVVLNFQQY